METNQESHLQRSYKGYIRNLGIISLVLLFIAGVVFYTLLQDYFLWVYPFVVFYFFIINAFQHLSLVRSSVRNPRMFQTDYLMWFGVKLFLNLTFVLIYILADKPHALHFVMGFGLCYVIYTVYEVSALSKILRKRGV